MKRFGKFIEVADIFSYFCPLDELVEDFKLIVRLPTLYVHSLNLAISHNHTLFPKLIEILPIIAFIDAS